MWRNIGGARPKRASESRQATHADPVKLIIVHYIGIPLEHMPLVNMDNASASLLVFHPDESHPPSLLSAN